MFPCPNGFPASPFPLQALPCLIGTMSWSDSQSVICTILPFIGLIPHTPDGEHSGPPEFRQYPFDTVPWSQTPSGSHRLAKMSQSSLLYSKTGD